MWRQAPEDIKRPYLDQTEANRRSNHESGEKWAHDMKEWEARAVEIRERWCKENPFESWRPFPVNGDGASHSNLDSIGSNGAILNP